MESYDIGRVIGEALMSFAVFVIFQAVIAKIPFRQPRYPASAIIAFLLAMFIIWVSPAPLEITIGAAALLVAACIWHFTRYGRAPKK